MVLKKLELRRLPTSLYTCVLLRRSREWCPVAEHAATGHFLHPTLLPYHLTMEVLPASSSVATFKI